MKSLLGQFYHRIRGSQEDIATEGLTYVLQQSQSARDAVKILVRNEVGLDIGNLDYVTQDVGINLERPDISGKDNSGKELLIIEAKFWASLTDNQPVEYLSRLAENSLLIFVCPSLRTRPLFQEIDNRLQAADIKYESESDNYLFTLKSNRYLMIKSWTQVLNQVRQFLVQDNEQSLVSDIDQIRGLVEIIDSQAFLPIQDKELSPSYARRISSFYDLIDHVVSELKIREIIDTTGLKTVGQKYGYSSYMRSERLGIALNLNMDLWSRIADTPFWIYTRRLAEDVSWYTDPQHIQNCLDIAARFNLTTHQQNPDILYVALFPLKYKMEDVVVRDLADQIQFLIEETESRI